ncbi:lipid-binding SYLF domain-containing protein [Humitalea rosea]|uniref:Lipid-binding SYLF domain-containing protein n=2 Tax=Humitalea rosea TaxID=990373 RepID=A0A2W7IV07_9PROT|nr:lipid-binding SYLF domain-containing protein [Humitalea rosea]
MHRRITILTMLLGLLSACAGISGGQPQQQALVDRATLTVQEIATGQNNGDFNNLLRRSRAAMICPRVFRAGFIFGGEGGACVLVARDGAGSWSSPAFYTMGSGSFGLQIGVQDAQIVMIVLTDRGLNALLNNQFKVGADASVAVAQYGGGIEGSTTANVGADIVAFARASGLFAGLTIEGSILTSRPEANRSYYGNTAGARQIVVDMAAHNPGADPLRAALMHYGTRQAP